MFGVSRPERAAFSITCSVPDVLPEGVIPVTSVVTDLRFAEREQATIEYLDGRCEDVPITSVGDFAIGKGQSR